ncbi:MAG: prepilin-type N-terminal cleavage/methylation domain-containing protein [Elusimicrobiota bacterium]|nr:prepilin-type N-terminal cleavage/methylation domain-containing protein [Elusimicrobiota bacterium]
MKSKAFTLVEIMVALTIFAIILVSFSLLLKTGIKSFLHGYFSTQLFEEASGVFSDRGTSRGMVSYLRETGAVIDAQPSLISFVVDGGTVTYRFEGNRIMKNSSAGESVLSEHAGSLLFRYYSRGDGNWTETYSPAETGAVSVYLKLVKGGVVFPCFSGAFLRNGTK